MLVLRRKVGQRIVIAGDIIFEVLAIERGKVKIGVSGPPGVNVVREELLRDEAVAAYQKEGQHEAT